MRPPKVCTSGLPAALNPTALPTKCVAAAHRDTPLWTWQVRPLLLSAGITFLMGAVGATLSQLVYSSLSFLPQQLVISICTSIGFGFAATFFKAQED